MSKRCTSAMNFVQPIENVRVPWLTVLCAAALDPKGCKVSPFYVLQQAVKHRGSPHYADIVVEKIQSTSTSASLLCIQGADDGVPIMIIEIKKVTPVQLIDIHYKDMMEMLIYCLYITRQPLYICGAITDIFHWHVTLLKPYDNKVEILKYTYFNIENEDELLGILQTDISLMNLEPNINTCSCSNIHNNYNYDCGWYE